MTSTTNATPGMRTLRGVKPRTMPDATEPLGLLAGSEEQHVADHDNCEAWDEEGDEPEPQHRGILRRTCAPDVVELVRRGAPRQGRSETSPVSNRIADAG